MGASTWQWRGVRERCRGTDRSVTFGHYRSPDGYGARTEGPIAPSSWTRMPERVQGGIFFLHPSSNLMHTNTMSRTKPSLLLGNQVAGMICRVLECMASWRRLRRHRNENISI